MNQPSELISTELLKTLIANGVQVLNLKKTNTLLDKPNVIEIEGSIHTLLEFVEKNSVKSIGLISKSLSPEEIENFAVFYNEKIMPSIEQTAKRKKFDTFCSEHQKNYEAQDVALDAKQTIISNLHNIGRADIYLFKEGFVFQFTVIETWYQLYKEFMFPSHQFKAK